MQATLERVAPVVEHEFGVQLGLRIGVNTGPVIAGDPSLGQRLVTGDAVNVAARLEQTAGPGEVVIGSLTGRLAGEAAVLEPLAPLTLKGKAEPVPASRVLRVVSGPGARARLELPLVGRDRELDAMQDRFQEAVRAQACRRLTIRGEAGIGKSRLVYEMIDRLPGNAWVLRGTCPSYGEGITFWPVVELIQAASGSSPSDAGDTARAAIATLLPAGDPAVERLWSIGGLSDRQFPVPELVWAVRRLLGHLAEARPLVVVIDGLHWAEPTLVELLDDLDQNLRDAPVLLVTMERPSEDDAAVDPTGGRPAMTPGVLELGPLEDGADDEIVAAALGHATLPPALMTRVKQAAAGNPLFIEQFLTMLIDEGLLISRDGAWLVTADIEHVQVPPTIEAVLAARVDALGGEERQVLEPASVIGRDFSRTAVETLLETPIETDAVLGALIRRQLVARSRDPDLLADHRFRNLLLRDVVYDGLLKRTRSVLHLRFADWLESFSSSTGRRTEMEEILGYHLEQAYHLRSGLGALDAEAVQLGRRAADRLAPAGLRAFGRGDMPAAANLLGRAARALPDDDSTRPRLLARAAEARMETGAFPDSVALYDEAEANAIRSADPVAAGIAELGRLRLRYLTGDGVTDADARALVDRLTPVFASAEDHRALAGCHRLLFNVELTHGQWNAAGVAAESMIEEARRANDQLMEQRGLPALAGVAMYGPTPVPEAIERCEAVLAQAGGDRMVRALTERAEAHLMAFDGRFDEARDLCRATRGRLVELGWHFDAALVSLNLGPIELLAGQPDAAVRELRTDYDTLRAMGEQNYISTTAAYLAEALRQQGNLPEALEFAGRSAEIATDDDIYTQALWRATRARALEGAGSAEEAERLAQEAVTIALVTDDPSVQADMFLAQADVLTRHGSIDPARRSIAAALERYRAKGHRVGERLASEALDRIAT
jgi:tetratricopeptide (TPR) repeat protein